MNITASQLAFILNVPQAEANAKIAFCLGYTPDRRDELKEDKNLSVEVRVFEKKNFPIQFAIDSIKKNALKPGPYRGFLVDYPLSKLKTNKSTGFYPASIRLPEGLRSLLTHEQLSELKELWTERYSRISNTPLELNP